MNSKSRMVYIEVIQEAIENFEFDTAGHDIKSLEIKTEIHRLFCTYIRYSMVVSNAMGFCTK